MYIGKEPIVGNFQKCDAITVVNGQAAYTLQVSSTNVVPESANHMLVSLNGILQAPVSSFTVSGSTLTFASNLATGDVIDFVILLGNVLDLGVPSDNTVSTAKIVDDAVTSAKINNDIISGSTELATAPADTDEFLVSDAGTLKRIDYSLIKGGGAFEKISTTDLGDGSTASVQFNTLSTDYVDFRVIVTGLESVTHQEVFAMYVKRAGQSSFDTSSSNYLWASHGYRSDGEFGVGNSGDSILKLHSGSLASQSGVDGASHNFIIDIFNPHDTWNKKFIGVQSFFTEGDYGRAAAQTGSGYRNSKEAIIGLEFLMTGGTMSTGVFTLYGRKQ